MELLSYLLPFIVFAAFFPFVREQQRRRGLAPGSLRGDLVALSVLLAVVVVAFLALDAAGAAETVVYLVPLLLGAVVFIVLERAAR